MVLIHPHGFRTEDFRGRKSANVAGAFTLVELLVVIGIIALLISILMPALTRAREASERIACLSNVRQIGMGFHQYADAHRGSLPPLFASPAWTDWWCGLL